jgi:hypothetical protein
MDASQCKARHSHSVTQWKNYIVISGGLDQFENPLSEIILFDPVNLETKRFILKEGTVLPRLDFFLFLNNKRETELKLQI